MAEGHTGVAMETCITTVPDYFTQQQREIMKQVLQLAGCREKHVISNSIAGNALRHVTINVLVAIDYSRNVVKSENVLFVESGSQGKKFAFF
jgi:molecular chaperone DnaK (HSP70)